MSIEEKRAVKLLPEFAERMMVAAERQADALEKIDDKLSGIINVLDQLDTNLGHHLADIANEIKDA